VANAEETLRDSVLTGRGRSSSVRSFVSFEDSGRNRRLHREVVQGRASSMDMAIIVLFNSFGIDDVKELSLVEYVVLSYMRVVVVAVMIVCLFDLIGGRR
jgi:hypothetical protein